MTRLGYFEKASTFEVNRSMLAYITFVTDTELQLTMYCTIKGPKWKRNLMRPICNVEGAKSHQKVKSEVRMRHV